jgi:hypothetical protein
MAPAMGQALSRHPLTGKARLRAQFGLCEICGGENATRTIFSHSSSVFPVNIIHQCSILICHMGNEQ